mmetsp:Transcript_27139/g.105615  ORF Transcript_27139/g.105615 Transcript_27139/m.105615 type:complete len:1095 (-) Transcript_27139:1849-5133(-)|eukprot:CAMPEP_0113962010 /NCGR_PEP_ID=MMETSP0011_2-20120614/5659_1 /TAXON_ID=101924 /ORGANISM="Rhodosorus marinus" /LENGTH=1094 /DNA_ID=CAMNT_0000973779 /DNA_START=507 /DNA_END=3791 /DNA_ORIENTATION=+ /assembly_acc=CAM_ASM_000156
MEQLLDPKLPDAEFVALLERIIQSLYASTNADERNSAQSVLTRLQENPDSWLRVDKILDSPYASASAKFYALQILGDMIQYRWKLLPRETCEQIRDYVVKKVIEMSSDEETMRREQTYLMKLNGSLVQVVKQEWPANWRSFVNDIVGASKTSTSRCENNLQILSLLSEEVFQFSAGQLTQEKIDNLKSQFNNEFSKVFELCQFVFDQTSSLSESKPELLVATLNTLEKFLAWIPLGYIFETELINTLLQCVKVPALRNHALKCLVEIGSLSVGVVYDEKFLHLYISFILHLTEIVPQSVDIASAYEDADDQTQTFIMDLALFFSGFFRNNLRVLEAGNNEAHEALKIGLEYLVKISSVSEVEVFKTCLEFWHKFAFDLHHQQHGAKMQGAIFALRTLTVNPNGDRSNFEERMNMYEPMLSALRRVIISRVPKPEEVLIVEDDNGEIVRETIKDSDAIALYKTVKETLIYLCHLSTTDTEVIMLEKLNMQMNGSQWSWNNLNTLCWAIGSISGAMGEAEEKQFLVTVVKELLQLCEMKRGKDNKAVVASNIMYVVGQYPRFLRAHWKFLKTVVNKLFEFMHETHPGVQDMACDTFLKISQKCRRKFVKTQAGETQPFISEMLSNVLEIIKELQPHQVHSFYESCGWIVAVSPAAEQPELVKKLFELPNATFQHVIDEARLNEQNLQRREDMKSLVTILKTNARVASSLGAPYFVQLAWMFPNMMILYAAYSRMLAEVIRTGGPNMVKSFDARNIRSIKKEICRTIEAFLNAKDIQNQEEVMATIVSPMTEPMLVDYYESPPEVRDAEVLSLFSQVIVFTSGLPVPTLRLVFKSLFACTLEMIKNNFEDFPDARLKFFLLLRTINQYNFPALFTLDDDPAAAEAEFKLVINAVIWAIKHTERNVAETGLIILLELLQNVDKSSFLGYFYTTCFRMILNDILSVLTDTLHRPGFKYHAMILMHILSVVAKESVKEPMWNPSVAEEVAMAGSPQSNQLFVKNHLEHVLKMSFPNLTPRQVEKVVANMFGSLNDENAFKSHLRDFLIQTKEFSAGDNTDLYDEEKQAELAEKKKKEEERLAITPGLAPAPVLDEGMADN